MRVLYNNFVDNTRYVVDVKGDRIRIGRSSDNEVVLNSPFVAPRAAVLSRAPGGGSWELAVLGLNSVQVGEGEVFGGGRARVEGGQTFRIFPFTITLERDEKAGPDAPARRSRLDEEASQLLGRVHLELLGRMNLRLEESTPGLDDDAALLAVERNIEEIARAQGLLDRRSAELCDHCAGSAVRSAILESLVEVDEAAGGDAWRADAGWSALVTAVPEREEELRSFAARCIAALGADRSADVTERVDVADRGFWDYWEARGVGEAHVEFRRYLAVRRLKKEIKDVVYGYGPLEDLLRVPTISEIMVVDRDRIYIEKRGVVENSGRRFVSDAVTQAIIERIVARVGRQINKSTPLVDARLADGSRVNAVIPPLAVRGPCLTIRKFPARRLMVDDLIARGTLSRTVAEFLRAAVVRRCNILIAGGTGSGKTTLLNCLSNFIPDKERIVTIEDTAELQLMKEHVVSLETRPPNLEGAGEYTIRDLVKNALRMRPDRVVVGECRGAEALDMLQAMNTGHDGSLTTLHANSARDAVLRLEVLVQMAADLPIASIHRQIASAVDLVVQLSRLRDGRRAVTQVAEVVGVDDGGDVVMKDLFLLEGEGAEAKLAATGSLPTFMGELIERRLIDLETFYR